MNRKKWIKIGINEALIIVDMSVDFFRKNGKLYVSGVEGEVIHEKLVLNIGQLLQKPFDWVMPTRDWHPKDHAEYKIYGEHSEAFSPGAQIIPELEEAILAHPGFTYIYNKGTDNRLIGYSVVFADGYAQLISELTHLGIKRIFLVGLAYTHCVGESAIDFARQSIFEVFVVRDATLSVAPPYGNPELMDKKLDCFGVKRVYMSEFV